jgi:hypothetical protein
MNEQDKEAFEKWWGRAVYSSSPYRWDKNSFIYFELLNTWQAACEYKQKQIDFYKDRNKTLISKVESLNLINDGLHLLNKDLEAKLAEIELTEKVQGWRQTEMMLEDAYARMDIMSKQLAVAVEALTLIRGKTSDDLAVEIADEFLSKLEANKRKNDFLSCRD